MLFPYESRVPSIKVVTDDKRSVYILMGEPAPSTHTNHMQLFPGKMHPMQIRDQHAASFILAECKEAFVPKESIVFGFKKMRFEFQNTTLFADFQLEFPSARMCEFDPHNVSTGVWQSWKREVPFLIIDSPTEVVTFKLKYA